MAVGFRKRKAYWKLTCPTKTDGRFDRIVLRKAQRGWRGIGGGERKIQSAKTKVDSLPF